MCLVECTSAAELLQMAEVTASTWVQIYTGNVTIWCPKIRTYFLNHVLQVLNDNVEYNVHVCI